MDPDNATKFTVNFQIHIPKRSGNNYVVLFMHT
jgi:hypothetical protein